MNATSSAPAFANARRINESLTAACEKRPHVDANRAPRYVCPLMSHP